MQITCGGAHGVGMVAGQEGRSQYDDVPARRRARRSRVGGHPCLQCDVFVLGLGRAGAAPLVDAAYYAHALGIFGHFVAAAAAGRDAAAAGVAATLPATAWPTPHRGPVGPPQGALEDRFVGDPPPPLTQDTDASGLEGKRFPEGSPVI